MVQADVPDRHRGSPIGVGSGQVAVCYETTQFLHDVLSSSR